MRAVQNEDAPITPGIIRSMETCVQCRGCEPACPSAVPFGSLIETTRTKLAGQRRITPWWQRVGLRTLTRPRLLAVGSSLLALAQRARVVPSRRLGLPARLPVRRTPLRSSGSDVHLFTGCVMDAWQRDTHRAVQQVVEATGAGVHITGSAAPCCGALHSHAGLHGEAQRLARQVIEAVGPGSAPVLVDSAGCGAALKEYGRLLGTADAHEFSARVLDVHEWLAERTADLPSVEPLPLTVAIQDPCHLRHVQGAHQSVRTVLAPHVAEVVELDDDGLCCGAGGAYALLERDLAGSIRDRKLAAIERAGADVVVSANPGCSIHLAAAGVDVVYPLELVAMAIGETGAS